MQESLYAWFYAQYPDLQDTALTSPAVYGRGEILVEQLQAQALRCQRCETEKGDTKDCNGVRMVLDKYASLTYGNITLGTEVCPQAQTLESQLLDLTNTGFSHTIVDRLLSGPYYEQITTGVRSRDLSSILDAGFDADRIRQGGAIVLPAPQRVSGGCLIANVAVNVKTGLDETPSLDPVLDPTTLDPLRGSITDSYLDSITGEEEPSAHARAREAWCWRLDGNEITTSIINPIELAHWLGILIRASGFSVGMVNMPALVGRPHQDWDDSPLATALEHIDAVHALVLPHYGTDVKSVVTLRMVLAAIEQFLAEGGIPWFLLDFDPDQGEYLVRDPMERTILHAVLSVPRYHLRYETGWTQP